MNKDMEKLAELVDASLKFTRVLKKKGVSQATLQVRGSPPHPRPPPSGRPPPSPPLPPTPSPDPLAGVPQLRRDPQRGGGRRG